MSFALDRRFRILNDLLVQRYVAMPVVTLDLVKLGLAGIGRDQDTG